MYRTNILPFLFFSYCLELFILTLTSAMKQICPPSYFSHCLKCLSQCICIKLTWKKWILGELLWECHICVQKKTTAEQKQRRFYLYTSLWRSHRLAHNPVLLTGADLTHTWAWTWFYLTLIWIWSHFTLFKLSVKVCHWHCTVLYTHTHTPVTLSALWWQEFFCESPPSSSSTLRDSVSL